MQSKVSVKTPAGIIFAQELPDPDYPGIALLFDAAGNPGVIMEYNPIKKYVQIRVYSKDDPDGDPTTILQISE